ncbi:MAG: 50S ribosomal protein L11 methyltransferase [Calditrichota bacterium]
MSDYFELNLPLHGFNTDALSGVLQLFGCNGIMEASEQEWVVYLDGTTTPLDVENLLDRLKQLNPNFRRSEAVLNGQKAKDWNAEWKKHFVPLNPVGNLWICPPWEKPDNADAELLIIDPQMAFGTGHHETTALMLERMESMELAGKEVLDLGCGSGILAFLACMRNAARIIGIDIDPDSIDNARHNLRLNKLKDIDFRTGDINTANSERFDVILANIQFFILKPIANDIRKAINDGGQLLLSGLLVEEEKAVEELYSAAGFRLDRTDRKKEWISMQWTAV